MAAITSPSSSEHPTPDPDAGTRERRDRRRGIPSLVWGALGALIPGVLLAIHVGYRHEGNPTALYFLTPAGYRALGLERYYAAGEIRFRDGPYDGQYYLAFANDPLLRHALSTEKGRAVRFYRGRRIAWPWAGFLLGLGQPEAIAWALPLANLLLIGAATWALGRVLADRGRSPAWALLGCVSLGATLCLLRSLADVFATNLLVLGCCAWSFRRFRTAAVVFAAAALAKETTILLPACLGSIALLRTLDAARERVPPRRPALREALGLGLVPAAMIAWWGYLLATGPGSSIGNANVGVPGVGLIERLSKGLAGPADWEATALVVTLLGLATVPLAPRRAWDGYRLGAAAFVALALVTRYSIWEEVWGYGRIHMTVPALLLFAYALHGRKLDLVAPLAAAAVGLLVWSSHL
jgi:hypothetical protein